MIKEANVTVMVSDMDRTVNFYTETLGLKVKARYGKHFAQVQALGLVIALHPASKQAHRQARRGASPSASSWTTWKV